MLTQIPLEPIPNQSLDIALGGAEYTLAVREIQDGTCVISISRNGVLLVSSSRCVPRYYALRYKYLEADSGNFIWQTPLDEYPDYTKFGVTHFLYFVPLADLEAFRNG